MNSRSDLRINDIKAIYKIDSSKNSSFCQLNNQIPEEYYLFQYNVLQYTGSSTFRRNTLPPFSRPKSKPSNN